MSARRVFSMMYAEIRAALHVLSHRTGMSQWLLFWSLVVSGVALGLLVIILFGDERFSSLRELLPK